MIQIKVNNSTTKRQEIKIVSVYDNSLIAHGTQLVTRQHSWECKVELQHCNLDWVVVSSDKRLALRVHRL